MSIAGKYVIVTINHVAIVTINHVAIVAINYAASYEAIHYQWLMILATSEEALPFTQYSIIKISGVAKGRPACMDGHVLFQLI